MKSVWFDECEHINLKEDLESVLKPRQFRNNFPVSKMTDLTESKPNCSESMHMDETYENDIEDKVDTNAGIYPVIKTTVVIPSSKAIFSNVQPQQQQQHQQTTANNHRNGHSRNPSSINGITVAAQTIQLPPNKPDAINNLLKLIRFRSDANEFTAKSENPTQICGIREARLISKSNLKPIFHPLSRFFSQPKQNFKKKHTVDAFSLYFDCSSFCVCVFVNVNTCLIVHINLRKQRSQFNFSCDWGFDQIKKTFL